VRPVNLIPPERRRGARGQLRSGPLSYVVVGALIGALAGVALLVVTGNQISDREAEIAQLEREEAAAKARAARLAGYTQFHTIAEQRAATVAGLAASRFDWERVLRELALVLPAGTQLTDLTGTASSESSTGEGASVAMRSSVVGPALELAGCAAGQEAVAGLVQALKEIDGVTRVGVQSSELGGSGGGATSDSASAGGGDCQSEPSIAQFQMVVAFDAAPVPADGETEG